MANYMMWDSGASCNVKFKCHATFSSKFGKMFIFTNFGISKMGFTATNRLLCAILECCPKLNKGNIWWNLPRISNLGEQSNTSFSALKVGKTKYSIILLQNNEKPSCIIVVYFRHFRLIQCRNSQKPEMSRKSEPQENPCNATDRDGWITKWSGVHSGCICSWAGL